MEGAPFCTAPALVAGRTGLKPRCYCDPKPADAGSSHPASGCSMAAASVPDRALRLQDLTPLGLIRNVESRIVLRGPGYTERSVGNVPRISGLV